MQYRAAQEFETVWHALGNVELTSARAVSLLNKLPEQRRVVSELLLQQKCGNLTKEEIKAALSCFGHFDFKSGQS